MFDREPEPRTIPPTSDDDEGILPRDQSVLDAIQQKGLTVFTFDGLRRLLGMHQETLSRTLDRLEEGGLVEKVDGGYRLSEGFERTPSPAEVSSLGTPLVQTMLPPDIDTETIISSLKGRWFGSLRWLGYTQNENGTVLKWITDEEGTQLDARFNGNLLTVEARVPEGKDASDAINASYQLLSHISRLYRRPETKRRRNMLQTVAYYPSLRFA